MFLDFQICRISMVRFRLTKYNTNRKGSISVLALFCLRTCALIISPTYEVCGGIMFSLFRSFVRTFVRSSFRHRVKVFALKFIRPHILETLWWISFIFGMMVDIGLKVLSAPSPSLGWPWGQGYRIFIKSQFFFFVCLSLYSYIIKTLEEFHLYLTCW